MGLRNQGVSPPQVIPKTTPSYHQPTKCRLGARGAGGMKGWFLETCYPDYVKISKKTFGKEEYVTVPKDKWEERHVSANEV